MALMFSLPYCQDEHGFTTSMEGNEDIPFEIRRIYYLYDTQQGIQRGGHAHCGLDIGLCPWFRKGNDG